MTADRALDEAIAAVEQQFSHMFNRARVAWKQAAEQIHPDLQPAGYKILSLIVRHGTTNAHVLAEQLEMDKSVISRQVRTLEEFGLVESRPDAKDGRLRVLAPTATAIERVQAVRVQNQNRFRTALEGRSAEELLAFAELLGELAEA
ncbi:MarR family winged helix-turn-helix transcriptional regulator [Agromyces agglutinans]|nr:MarR family transcriptional regulator [Agromyces agglutinans]